MPILANFVSCVCTGNVCRSPMAEKLLGHALAKEKSPLSSLQVISTGISAGDGNAASVNSIQALQKVGLDLGNHRSRKITRELVDASIVLLCMTEMHRYLLNQIFGELDIPIILFREKLPSVRQMEIADPYGKSLNAYENCRDDLVEAIPSVVSYLRNLVETLPENK
ncbi:MAG: Protein-arginine-phosphatase [Candidatus Moanabacter tarae]|uniref:protein-tyrosine-phosphatase n=1 Tax=Candidatus Moanibacter tarae TaxID=2200854 RepID=A0A2Z4AS86_9BACT|nr:MAG: Protein-arginine-phosphatase [Candidatus Moanabacter tarae]